MDIVFIHGFLESPRMWDFMSPNSKKEYHVTSLPGHDNRPSPAFPPELIHYAEDIQNQMKALGIDRAVLVGHSMGGYIAAEMATLFPELVSAVVFFHSTSEPDFPEKTVARNRAIELVKKNKSLYCSQMIRSLFGTREFNGRESIISGLVGDAISMDESAIVHALESMRNRTGRLEEMINSQIPVAFVLGDEDPSLPPEKYEFERAKLNTRYTSIIENCGHMGQWEHPGITSNSIQSAITAVIDPD